MASAIRIVVIGIVVCCLLSIMGLVAVEFSPAIRTFWIEISDFLKPYVVDASTALRDYVPRTWTEIKWVFEFAVYFLAAIAAIGTLFRLPKIIELVRTIRDGHGEIWNLGAVAGKIREASAEATRATDEMKTVLAEIRENDLVGALEAVQKQLADLQRSSADDSAELAAQGQEAKSNWEEIRSIWLDTRKQLDDEIEKTPRINKRKYARLNHRDYTDIINKLREDNLISDIAARVAGYMNNTYLSFRNQRNPITDNVRQKFIDSKKAFDVEMRNFKPPALPTSPPPPPRAPRLDGNSRLPPNAP
jgi:hypothetical protein